MFRSSRKEKAAQQSSRPEDFMDEEDLNDYPEAGKTIVTRTDFDSITGARQRDVARRDVLGNALVVAKQTMGDRLLAVMGWREGHGVGERIELTPAEDNKSPSKPRRVYGVALGPGMQALHAQDSDLAAASSSDDNSDDLADHSDPTPRARISGGVLRSAADNEPPNSHRISSVGQNGLKTTTMTSRTTASLKPLTVAPAVVMNYVSKPKDDLYGLGFDPHLAARDVLEERARLQTAAPFRNRVALGGDIASHRRGERDGVGMGGSTAMATQFDDDVDEFNVYSTTASSVHSRGGHFLEVANDDDGDDADDLAGHLLPTSTRKGSSRAAQANTSTSTTSSNTNSNLSFKLKFVPAQRPPPAPTVYPAPIVPPDYDGFHRFAAQEVSVSCMCGLCIVVIRTFSVCVL